VYGIVGAIGTGLSGVGLSLIGASASYPEIRWLAPAGVVAGALGAGVSLVAKALGGMATPDKTGAP
jgi:hypothetical protein